MEEPREAGRFAAVFAVCLLACTAVAQQPPPLGGGTKYLDLIHAPVNLTPPSECTKPLVIAVVDDGVRITHRDIAPFVWTNPGEVAGNGRDDDGNGCVDDVNGWNVSDGNNVVAPPPDRLKEYHHGTHLAGIIAAIARRAYGPAAPAFIRIMPVKVLSDTASNTFLKDGYKGVAYALKNGARVILCAWGVGHISSEERSILLEAEEAGVLVVGAAGNIPDGTHQYPGAAQGAFSVAGLDEMGGKMARSNYGSFVGICAPGENVSSASSSSDDGYETHDGTSEASAMVAAAAALVEVQHPGYSLEMVEACLKNTAAPLSEADPSLAAKLGAGALDVSRAVSISPPFAPHSPLKSYQGFLSLSSKMGRRQQVLIQPPGKFKGIWLRPSELKGSAGSSVLTVYAGDSAKGRLVTSLPLSDFKKPLFVEGTSAFVAMDLRGASRRLDGLIEYDAEGINFATLYCHGTKEITREGLLDDGSGGNGYSPGTDCKWLITAPPGKRIHFKFLKFDTEARVDLLYFFDGNGTQDTIMAIFSGPNIPPEITTWHSQVLVWFVTDGKNQGKGWQAQVTFVDGD